MHNFGCLSKQNSQPLGLHPLHNLSLNCVLLLPIAFLIVKYNHSSSVILGQQVKENMASDVSTILLRNKRSIFDSSNGQK